MDCKRVSQVFYLFFDNELAEEEKESFEVHLTRCPACAQHVLLARKVLLTLRQRCNRHVAPTSLRVRILTSLPHRQG